MAVASDPIVNILKFRNEIVFDVTFALNENELNPSSLLITLNCTNSNKPSPITSRRRKKKSNERNESQDCAKLRKKKTIYCNRKTTELRISHKSLCCCCCCHRWRRVIRYVHKCAHNKCVTLVVIGRRSTRFSFKNHSSITCRGCLKCMQAFVGWSKRAAAYRRTCYQCKQTKCAHLSYRTNYIYLLFFVIACHGSLFNFVINNNRQDTARLSPSNGIHNRTDYVVRGDFCRITVRPSLSFERALPFLLLSFEMC